MVSALDSQRKTRSKLHNRTSFEYLSKIILSATDMYTMALVTKTKQKNIC